MIGECTSRSSNNAYEHWTIIYYYKNNINSSKVLSFPRYVVQNIVVVKLLFNFFRMKFRKFILLLEVVLSEFFIYNEWNKFAIFENDIQTKQFNLNILFESKRSEIKNYRDQHRSLLDVVVNVAWDASYIKAIKSS